jgi:hypothetical protein
MTKMMICHQLLLAVRHRLVPLLGLKLDLLLLGVLPLVTVSTLILEVLLFPVVLSV